MLPAHDYHAINRNILTFAPTNIRYIMGKKNNEAKPGSLKADKKTELLKFLLEAMPAKSRTTVKSYLSHNQVTVNGSMTSQFDHPLQPGDEVTITYGRAPASLRHPMLRIVFEDEWIIVAEKRNGLLSIATDKETRKTAFNILSDHVKKEDPDNLIFVLHRLDRETSGLMMFAKDQRIKFHMQEHWEETVVERKYYAVVEGAVKNDEGMISTYLTESKALKVYATRREEGKIARTGYKVLKRTPGNTLLELELTTGRKNQIRAHMEYAGHSIVGDKKYGAKTNPIGRVALHAGKLSFIHPVTGERLDFSTAIPRSFLDIFE